MLVLDDEQRMLRDAASRYFSDHRSIDRGRTEPAGHARTPDRVLWSEISVHGYTSMLVPASAGGLDLGFVESVLVARAVGESLSPLPVVTTAIISVTALRRAHSNAVAAQWMEAIARGEAIVALASDEGSRHQPDVASMVARRERSQWVLEGRKSFVPDGVGADAFIVVASTPKYSDRGLFLVPTKTPGLQVEPLGGVDGHRAVRLTLEGVQVSDDHFLRASIQEGDKVGAVLDSGRLGLAAEMAGIAATCFNRTLVHVGQRRQFGRTLGSFQALQHRLAHLHCQLEALESLLLAAARAADQDLASAAPLISAVKEKAERVGQTTVGEAIQLHGGIGMTEEMPFGSALRRFRVASETLGGAHFHANRFASLAGW